MKECKYYQVFADYIIHHKKALLCFMTFVLITLIIFYFYQIPAEPILYAAVLCSFIGIVFVIVDSFRYYQKHQKLSDLNHVAMLSLEQLPEAKNLLEEDYQHLLHTLFQYKCAIETKSDTEKSEMIDYYTMWVHQIKTPIAAMRLLLQSESLANNELENELFKIEQYVDMVLSYLRVDAKSSDYVFTWHKMDVLIKQCIRKYSKMFILKKISLDYQPTDDQILTDEKWFCFVVEQLLSNALKYTPSGAIHIYFEEGWLFIRDEGIGIDKADLNRIFEKGFTGYNGRVNHKSSGLGLYLCKRVCDNLGHLISIDSTVGVGTTVKIDYRVKKTQYE